MKVISAQMMAQLESTAYQNGCKEADFMEAAGQGIALVTQDYIHKHSLAGDILLLCGKGNNAGDAFVAGIYLIEQGCRVFAIQPDPIELCSPLCQKNRARFELKGGLFYNSFNDCPPFSLILDGIFGTGFKGLVKEPYASLIHAANQSHAPILSIDIPSGLDGTTGKIESCAIQASETIFLGFPKTGFFFRDGWNVVGHLHAVDFGLPKSIIEQAPAVFELLVEDEVAKLLPPMRRNRHKYQAGYVIGLAGSPSMPGAALLSSLAALRGGSGMVRLFHPYGMESELASSPYELIKLPYHDNSSQEVLFEMNQASATFVGPGLGRTDAVRNLLKEIIPHLDKPCVIDADALALLAEDPFQLPPQVILTPHTGEMQKLLHAESHLILSEELLIRCQDFAERYSVTLVLKGAPTFIFHPGNHILVNPTGDPGMATAGSGDVLTGLLASLLSQGLSCREAAALGVYLHGLAGEYAAQSQTSYGVIATDLITHFSDAYKKLLKSSMRL
ncbi:MAG: NAD(P)H-hydrate dehydratase [Chlamydiales bacterium]